MLTALFRDFLATSLSLAPVIVLLLLVVPFLRGRYSPQLRHLLWLAVAARMLLPLSLQDAARFVIPAGSPVFYLEDDSAAVMRAFAEAQRMLDAGAAASGAAAPPAISWVGMLAMLWVTGAVVYLAIHLLGYLLQCRKLRRWGKRAESEEVSQVMGALREELDIKRDIPVVVCKGTGPLLTGLLRPRIILPEEGETGEYLYSVLRHELTHYKRRDLWYKLLLLGAVSLHWFNPLVHLLAAQAEEDMELACDYGALQGMEFSRRRVYGMAVLSCVGQRQGISLSTSFFSGKKHMARRLRGIVDSSAKRRGVPVFCIVFALLVASAALVGCGRPGGQESSGLQFLGMTVNASRDGLREPAAGEITDNPAVMLEDVFLEELEKNQQMSEETQRQLEQVYDQLEPGDEEYAYGTMKWPVPGYYMINSYYGWRFGGQDFHTGLDIGGSGIYGQPVIAAADGRVKHVNTGYTAGAGYGIYMIVDHGGGISTLYAQLSGVTVSEGDFVKQGQQIAAVGSTGFSTGPHLHFEVRVNGMHTSPQLYLMDEQEGE